MTGLKITLPFPPSVNGLFGGGSKQKRFPSKAYKKWLSECPELPKTNYKLVRLHYKYYFPDNRERDTENYIKAVSDFLVKQNVIENDSWKHIIDNRQTPMGIDKNNPRVEIDIEVLTES